MLSEPHDVISRHEKHFLILQEICSRQLLFKNFIKISKRDFEYLVQKIRPDIKKQDTVMTKAMPFFTILAFGNEIV